MGERRETSTAITAFASSREGASVHRDRLHSGCLKEAYECEKVIRNLVRPVVEGCRLNGVGYDQFHRDAQHEVTLPNRGDRWLFRLKQPRMRVRAASR